MTNMLNVATRGHFDIAYRLPPAGREKLLALRQRAEEQGDLVRAELDRKHAAHEAWQREVVDHTRLQHAQRQGSPVDFAPTAGRWPDGVLVPENPAGGRVEQQAVAVKRAKDELDRRDALVETKAAKRAALARTVESLEAYLKKLGDVSVPAYAGTAPSRGSLGAVAALEQHRTRLTELRAERKTIATAPRPSAEVKDIARRWVNHRAVAGAPSIARLIDGGSDDLADCLPTAGISTIQLSGGHRREGGSATIPDAIAMICWLARASLLEEIDKLIDAQADDANAIPAEEKARRLAENGAAILATERAEEYFLSAAEAEGFDVLRRPDCDPRALLGLSDSLPDPQDLQR